MMRSFFAASILFAAFFAFSCSESSSSTGPSNTVPVPVALVAYENPVAVAVAQYGSVMVKGGSGPYAVTAISDSSVLNVYASSYYSSGSGTNTIHFSSFSLSGLKTGTSVLTIRDSARTGMLQVTVTVMSIAASPSTVTMHPGKDVWVHPSGGSGTFSISRGPNIAVASAVINESNAVVVTGVAAGTTDVIIQDNAVPPHTVTVPITVTLPATFTTPGQFSFSSSKGEFAASGIMPAGMFQSAPTEGEGAGALRLNTGFFGPSDIVVIYGYKVHSATSMDIIAITTAASGTPSSRTMPVTVSQSLSDSATVLFAFNGNPNVATADVYQLTTGSVEFSQWSDTHITGKLSGSGLLTSNGGLIPGMTVTMTNGVFDVPQVRDDLSMGGGSAAPARMAARMAERMVRKWYHLRTPASQR